MVEKKDEFKQEYLKTYVPGFDALIGEGIPKGSAILVAVSYTHLTLPTKRIV